MGPESTPCPPRFAPLLSELLNFSLAGLPVPWVGFSDRAGFPQQILISLAHPPSQSPSVLVLVLVLVAVIPPTHWQGTR
ncbi:hypothetical protein BP00DRAFT_427091 [Aspergillus indologenus CBS 114.80]|uniref:Uncharacterized protein n=1 Tax=Aspergillus indologenus CBS 114.80 TaxID=1450541 RepID=A0A2V5J6D4_9EURO|nr:hypothetical protein BP00DRAFT_427091 [Aspergillus indologenus CBS 114.80]